jgi:hypothetical protein
MNQATVTISSTGFSPNPLTISANTLVIWQNTTAAVQDATSNDSGQTFTTGQIQPGQHSLPITFSGGPSAQQIPYSSTASGLTGSITVQAAEGQAAAVSFAADILPLFTATDIAHMQPMGVLIGQYSYMSDAANHHQNATTVQAYLTGTQQPRMPLGGPYWTPTQLSLFAQWMSDGYQP